MKLPASAHHPFSLQNSLPFVDHWSDESTRRRNFAVRPFAFQDTDGLVARTDAIARKQEVVCTVILVLCFCCTLAVCLVQLARL